LKRPDNTKVHIIGAGIMGLMIARKLIVAGKRVALYDRGKVGAESSWAGGGILTPLYPWRQPQLLTTLTLRSQALYPELVASLIKETSIDPELERSGMLVLAADDVAEARSWAGKNRVKVQVADHNQVGSVEPHLNTSLDLHGLLFPEIGHIRNPRTIRDYSPGYREQNNQKFHDHKRKGGN